MIQRPSRCACSSGRRISAPRHSSAQKAGHCLWPGLPFGRVTATVVIVFTIVYLGMILGGLPFLQLDRTGVALLGAIALVASGDVSFAEAGRSVHAPTLILLFAFMVLSAQLRLSGFYTYVTRRLAAVPLAPPRLLGALILVVGALSAVFSNDIICLAMAPVLVDACVRRRLDPVPYLLALACAANVGSALTLIGNPQNMLIGESLGLSFSGYLREAAVPVLLGLAVTWALIVLQVRGRWDCPAALLTAEAGLERRGGAADFNRWQAAKGLTADAGLDLTRPGTLFVTAFVLGNVVSNVPAVMLLLPLATHPMAGTLLALVSTLSGNLLIVGSIANIIVVDAAERRGLRIDWRRHASVGVPVTFATLAIAGAYLWLRLAST